MIAFCGPRRGKYADTTGGDVHVIIINGNLPILVLGATTGTLDIADNWPISNERHYNWSQLQLQRDDRNYIQHSRDSIEAMRPDPAIQARQPDKVRKCLIGRTRWFPGLGSLKDKKINKRKRFLRS